LKITNSISNLNFVKMFRPIISSVLTVSIINGAYIEVNAEFDRLNNELIDAEQRMIEAKKRYEDRDFRGSREYYRQYKSELMQQVRYEENRYNKIKEKSDSVYIPVFIGCINGVFYPIKTLFRLMS